MFRKRNIQIVNVLQNNSTHLGM